MTGAWTGILGRTGGAALVAAALAVIAFVNLPRPNMQAQTSAAASGQQASPSTGARAGETMAAQQRLKALVPQMQKNLRENVLPFWFPRSVDTVNGGFTVHYGPDGKDLPGGTKMIVTQARQLWLASRLLRSGAASTSAQAGSTSPRAGVAGKDLGFRAAADAGFRFLRDRMWDKEHGGFYWEVDPTGKEVRRPHKHLYGQAFGLYALSEYAIATKSAEALALANTLFDLLEAKAYDREYGGYREFFARDWSAPPAGVQPYLTNAIDGKLMNTHLHLLEAWTTYVRAGGRPLARERLDELIAIETQAVVRKGLVACTDRYLRDWTPVLDGQNNRISYGHDLENIWLVVDALRALNRPTAPYHDLFRDLFAYSQTYGGDTAQGGFFESGPPKQPADRRAKIWWVQAEALVSALTMFELTGEAKYAEVAEGTWTWIDTKQTDWTSGEWYEAIEPDGRPRASNKATQWKAGYHDGRALIEALERLDQRRD